MGAYLGIDLGGTNIAAGVVDENYKLVKKLSEPTHKERSFAEIVQHMAAVVKKALSASGIGEDAISYVGIGVPSPINPVNSRVTFAANLGWKDADLVGTFQKHWQVPVLLANDADSAALGEALAGAAKQYPSALAVTLGTGVGGGLVVDNRLWLGGDGQGIEPGHATLVYDGFPCACGRHGCIESYASITALIRQTIDSMLVHHHSLMWELCGRDLNRVNGRTAFDAAKKGDAAGQAVVEQYIGYVGASLSSLVTLYHPHAVLLGGGVSNEGEYLLGPVRRIVEATIHGHDVLTPPVILKAELGNDAGIIGAALLGCQPG